MHRAIDLKGFGKIVGTDGERKMSKSIGNIIGIFEDETTIRKQIMSSFTDPNRLKATDPGKVEGNPVFLYHDLLNQNTAEVEDLKNRYRLGQVGDVEVKEALLAHQQYFAQARAEASCTSRSTRESFRNFTAGAARASQSVAQQTLAEVYATIGLK